MTAVEFVILWDSTRHIILYLRWLCKFLLDAGVCLVGTKFPTKLSKQSSPCHGWYLKPVRSAIFWMWLNSSPAASKNHMALRELKFSPLRWLKSQVFWNTTPCKRASRYRRPAALQFLHLQVKLPTKSSGSSWTAWTRMWRQHNPLETSVNIYLQFGVTSQKM